MPQSKFQEAVVEQEVPQVAQENVSETPIMENFKEVIKSLIANGAKRFNGVTVKNVKTEVFDEYTRVTLVTKEQLPAYVSDDNGVTYHDGFSNNVFSSTFAIAGTMKENEDLSWMANSIIDHPDVLNLILNGSKVDIIVQKVDAKTEYVNPFTTKTNPEPTIFENDTYVKYVVNIELGRTGLRMADKLADKLMGF